MTVPPRLVEALASHYRFEREIGTGGMATVYLAHDLKHGRDVAVKVLHPAVAATLGPARFLREIEIAARLTHPNILPLHDSGDAGGFVYYVMPYVAGESLRARLRRERQLSVDEAVRIACEVAAALDNAHRHGVVHRDIKPENILIEDGHAVVADFGIARVVRADPGGDSMTQAGVIIGTPTYMSPEQASGEHVDGRSDIYSLGCVLFEMLTGSPPFAGTGQEVFASHLVDDAPGARASRPAVPEVVDDAIRRALSKRPAERFASAREFRTAIERSREKQLVERLRTRRASFRASRWMRRRPALVWLVIAALLLPLAYGFLSPWLGPPASSGAPRSIVVLPFDNASGDPDDRYFAEGMAEELSNALTAVPGLRVLSGGAAARGDDVDAPLVARAVGAEAALRGSVRRSGGRIRIASQLIDATDGAVIWGQTFTSDSARVFDLQDEMSRAVVRALSLRTARGASGAAARRPTADLEAYDLYLRGRYFWNRRTVDDLRRSAEYLERALARDSTFALAWSGLADAYLLLGSPEYAGMVPSDAFTRARTAAQRALRLDERLAEPHASLANVLENYDYDFAAAEREYRRALELDPRYATAHQWYAFLLVTQSRFDEAEDHLRTALELDPLSGVQRTSYARLHYFRRQHDSALTHYRRALEVDSTFVTARLGSAMTLIAMKRYPDAIAELERMAAMTGGRHPIVYPMLGHALARAGHRADAQRILDSMLARERSGYVPPELIALVAIGLGDRDRAFEYLEKARRARSSLLVYLRVEPLVDPLRGDPRLEALARRIGL